MVTARRVPGRFADDGPEPDIRYIRTVDSPNCTGACGWLAAVQDGTIIDLKPAADYPDPAYNPRCCLRGMSATSLIYHPDRLKTPLIRAGERGEGKWREAGWDEALDLLAAKFKQIAAQYGPESIVFFNQVIGTGNVQKGAQVRLATLLGASYATGYDYNGDISMGYTETVGIDSLESESSAWAEAKTLILWGANILQTRMPDAKFVLKAQENGSRVVVIDPRAAQTSKAADLWLPLVPGTDGLLALGLCRLIIENHWLDLDFIRTFTDLPLLVRLDTGERLRASDLGLGTSDEFVAVVDPTQSAGPVNSADSANLAANSADSADSADSANPANLANSTNPDENNPATAGGTPPRFVGVSPQSLRLEDGTQVSLQGSYTVRIGSQPVTVRPAFALLSEHLQEERYALDNVARETGLPAGDIAELARLYAQNRPAQIIIGMGVNHRFHSDLAIRSILLLGALTGGFGKPGQSVDIYSGQHHVRFDISPWWYPDGHRPNVISMHYVVMPEKSPTMNAKVHLPRQGFHALFFSHANIFTTSHVNEWQRIRENLDFIVAVDFMKTSSTELADLVLPAPTFWEKYELVVTGPHPYAQIQQPVIPPRFESKSEFWMMKELARRLNPEWESYFNLSEEEVIDYLLANGGPISKGITLAALKKGPVRLNLPNPDVPLAENIANQIPLPPRAYPHQEGAQREFLKTGRMEFYKEEKSFREAGESLPTYKNAYSHLTAEERKFSLAFMTPHAKWRVHSTHVNNPWLQNLNRRPVVEINPSDASSRQIKDGDKVEIFNLYGRFQLWARVTESIRPGALSVDHGWWGRYLARGEYNNVLLPERVKPVQETYFLPAVYAPGQLWKDPRVEIRRVD
ncbi:perchlorate reductase subunit alpha precursor [Peptococcaceae bacterium CEB3]|nr:perchlorate reductase subunit alpha precursor [Peptococcaceae bacterium CEB3]